MKKSEVIAMQNRLEYLKDKVQRLDFENRKYKRGLEEIQTSTEILLKTVALEKGTNVNGGKELWISRRPEGLDEWDVTVTLDEKGQRIGVRLGKKV